MSSVNKGGRRKRRWPRPIVITCPFVFLLALIGGISSPGCAPPQPPAWTGFVHGLDGQPLVSTDIRVTVVGEHSSRLRETRTSPRGEFELLIGPEDTSLVPTELCFELCVEEERQSQLEDSPVGTWGQWTPPRRAAALASVALPGAEPSGPVDLGDVLLAPLPLLASGKVVDEYGKPVEDAFLVPQFHDDDDTAFHMWTLIVRTPPSARRRVHMQRGDRWPPVYNWMAPRDQLAGLSGADGRFELRGDPHGGLMRLEVSANDLVVYETPPFAPGSENVLAVLRHTGSLAGSIHDSGVLGLGLRLELVYPDDLEPAGTETPLHRQMYAEEDGTFDFGKVAAGIAELRISSRSASGPVLVIPKIEIPEGGAVDDPRLRNIDLSDNCRRIELRIVDEEGRRIPEGRVQYLSGVSGDTPTVAYFEKGRASLALRPGRKEMVVTASGYLRHHLEAVDGDTTVVLERGIPVTLVLPEELAIPVAPFSLRVSMIHPSGRAWWQGSREVTRPFMGYIEEERGEFDSSGESSLLASAPGEYELEIWIHHDRGDHYNRHEIPLRAGAEFVIEEGAESVQHTIEPDAAIYEEKLSEIGG